MFERFTDDARKIMALANKIAGRRGDDFVGVEHILLAILSPEGVEISTNQQVIELFGFAQKSFFQQFQEAIPNGKGVSMEVFGKLPITVRAKKAVDFSIEESKLHIGTAYIGPEHILLGLIREDEGIAAVFLKKAGLTLDLAREVIYEKIQRPKP